MQYTWTSEPEPIEAGGPSVQITYRKPNAEEFIARQLALAELMDTVTLPKPGEQERPETQPRTPLAFAMKTQAAEYRAALPLIMSVTVDGAPAAPEQVRDDGLFVPLIARHARFLFRGRAAAGDSGPQPDRGAPEVPGEPA